MKKKIVILSLALVLAFALGIGGTLAWLTAQTSEVKNTFTTAGIDITLTETWNAKSKDDLTANDIWKAQLIPGYTYKKDPVVTVTTSTTEDCWLFVKFEEKNNPSTYLDYTSTLTTDNDWTQGEGTGEGKDGIPTTVWYRKVAASDTTKSWNLLKDDTVSVKDSVTRETMPTANATPELVYTAYACQYYKNNTEHFTAAEAWSTVSSAS